MTGFFITFEGGEGSGKTTQIDRLAETLRRRRIPVVVTREPGGSPGADAVRQIILSGAAEALGAEIETILFAAARIDHIAAVIAPALAADKVVLCDRFHDSTRVYQGLAGVDRVVLDGLERAVLDGLVPDLTLILDIPAREGLGRAAGRRGESVPDRFERESLGLHEARRNAFLGIARAEPDRCVVIDAARPADEISAEIGFLVAERLEISALQKSGRRLGETGQILGADGRHE
ncbi:thymidylate kinase [Aureimonas sp. SA4125]|uniref:dTMP kinase n=1 Tax=Aureimonas sp. SA4125 TaxID=2826993 RepID=UPI001CC7A166|nr:dTMP kinase [Aureimonas sp. SA4125]BDA84627.1 thymidylate kinase [Aureimonas sp. SA4125]